MTAPVELRNAAQEDIIKILSSLALGRPAEPLPATSVAERSSMSFALFVSRLGLDRERLSYLASLAMLVAIAAWGHHTGWRLGGTEDPPSVSSQAGVPLTANGIGHAGPIDLPKLVLASDTAAQRAGIATATVERQPLRDYITANATVAYNQNSLAQLASRVPGTVWRIEKQVGSSIERGDLLAIIEAPDVGHAKADFLQKLVHSQLKRKNLERLQSADGSIPERQVREAEASVRESQIALYNAQHTLTNLGLPVRLASLTDLPDAELTRRVQFLGLPDSVTQDLDPELTTANLLPLVAPFDGVVIGRDVAVGETVSAQSTQFTIADISRVWIRLQVRKEDANLVRLGQAFEFTDDGIPGAVRGTIDWISTEVDEQSRTLEVRAEVDNPEIAVVNGAGISQRLLRARTFGTGRILVAERDAAVVVPNAAIQLDGSRRMVFVRQDARTFVPRVVETGIVAAGLTEIVAGLEPGDVVVTQGSHLLKSERLRQLASHSALAATPTSAAPTVP